MSGNQRLLFDVLVVPPKVTHVRFHESVQGRMGPKIGIPVGEHLITNFPIDEMTRSWVLSYLGPGTYRLGWMAVDEHGKEQRLGASGNTTFTEEDESISRRKAPTPATEAAPAPLAAPAAVPRRMKEDFDMLAMYRQIQSECRQQEAADFQARTERDRVFFAYMLQLAQGGGDPRRSVATPDEIKRRLEALEKGEAAEDDADGEGTGNFFVQMAKAFGKEIAPAIGPIVRDAMAAKAGTP